MAQAPQTEGKTLTRKLEAQKARGNGEPPVDPLTSIVVKVPAVDRDMERSVLASGLQDQAAMEVLSDQIRPDELYVHAHQQILRAMLDLYCRSNPVDAITVAAVLEKWGVLQECGGLHYLEGLVDGEPRHWHADYYCKEVRELSRRRKFGQRCEMLALQARDPSVTFEDLVGGLEDFNEITSDSGAQDFKWYTPQELAAAAADQKYLIRHLLAESAIGTLGGPYKALKSTMAAAIAFSLATGCRFLGHFDTTQAPVGLMTGESGLAAVQSMLTRIAGFHGCSLDSVDPAMLHTTLDVPRADRPEHVRYLRKTIKERQLKLLMIDPAIIGMGNIGDRASNVFEMSQRLMVFADLGRELGCTILFLHHFRHGLAERFAPATLADLSFTGFSEISAQWILLSRRAAFEPETGRHALWLVTGGRAGHCGTWALDIDEGRQDDPDGRKFDVVISKPSAAAAAKVDEREARRNEREAMTLSKRAGKVLEAVARYPEGESARVIRLASSLNPEAFTPALNSLLDRGQVEACKIKKGKKDYDGFRLASGTGGTGWTVPFSSTGGCVCDGTPPLKEGSSSSTHHTPHQTQKWNGKSSSSTHIIDPDDWGDVPLDLEADQ